VVRGFERDIVTDIFGIDSMQALVLSLHTIPSDLAALARETLVAGSRVVSISAWITHVEST
jgi:hypothetical protein